VSGFKGILDRRKDRLIATVLGFKESDLDKYLPSEVSQAFRKLLLDQINDYANMVDDVLKSYEGDIVVNEEYARMLEEIHGAIVDGPTV
jgi:hypothetical protein